MFFVLFSSRFAAHLYPDLPGGALQRCHLILPWQQLQGILLSTCMCMCMWHVRGPPASAACTRRNPAAGAPPPPCRSISQPDFSAEESQQPEFSAEESQHLLKPHDDRPRESRPCVHHRLFIILGTPRPREADLHIPGPLIHSFCASFFLYL
jgi:hypothetical protein